MLMKQCTKSKTGLGAQVHTQQTRLHAQAERIAPRQRTCGAVSWPSTSSVVASGRPCRRRTTPCRGPVSRCALCYVYCSPCCVVSRHSQWPFLTAPMSRYCFCIVTRFPQWPAHDLLSRYNDCTVTHSPAKKPPVTIQYIVLRHSFPQPNCMPKTAMS